MPTTAVQMHCNSCGSERVTRDAWAEWDVDTQSWLLATVYDYAYCHDCDEETRIEERPAIEQLQG